MQIYGEFEDFRNQTVHEVWVGFISMTPVIWSSLISAVIKTLVGWDYTGDYTGPNCISHYNKAVFHRSKKQMVIASPLSRVIPLLEMCVEWLINMTAPNHLQVLGST